MPLIEQVDANLRSRNLLGTPGDLLVAVSGGLDSMVLLHVLHQLAVSRHWRLTVAHFNHRLRGRASAEDERFVRRAAKSLGLTCVAGSGDVKALAGSESLSIEMAARRLRHEFLAQAAVSCKASHIALGHHADDQVELFFLRLLRGAGSDGLSGMLWANPSPADSGLILVRPLLDVSKKVTKAFARAQGIRFREDASNRDVAMDRNRIRHKLMPWLEKEFRSGLAPVILRQMELLREESSHLSQVAREWVEGRNRIAFERLPVAIQRRCVQLQLQELQVGVDFDRVEELRLGADHPVMVAPGMTLSRSKRGRLVRVILTTPDEAKADLAMSMDGGNGRVDFGQKQFRWAVEPMPAGGLAKLRQSRRRTEWFDAGRIGKEIVLRHWKPGDRYQPIGMKGAVKLQDLFTNAKIPRDKRRTLVVACTSRGRIWWVEGLRISEPFKIRPGTRRVLRWAWSGKKGSEPIR